MGQLPSADSVLTPSAVSGDTIRGNYAGEEERRRGDGHRVYGEWEQITPSAFCTDALCLAQ